MKFKDFQAPVLFSSTFKALNLGFKYFQELPRMRENPASDRIFINVSREIYLVGKEEQVKFSRSSSSVIRSRKFVNDSSTL